MSLRKDSADRNKTEGPIDGARDRRHDLGMNEITRTFINQVAIQLELIRRARRDRLRVRLDALRTGNLDG